jgi:hypothetical protein
LWDAELLSSCLLSKTVRPWNRIISVELLHNHFVICYVIERLLQLAIVPAGRSDGTSGQSKPDLSTSGCQVRIYPLLELNSENETVRFCSTSTSAIVFARGKMNIFDFFAKRDNTISVSHV